MQRDELTMDNEMKRNVDGGENGLPGWAEVERGRIFALACRLDRSLQEAAATASRPEAGLADVLRGELGRAVGAGAAGQSLLDAVATIHSQLDYLPKPAPPKGMRVFFREVLGPHWDERIVIAPTAVAAWRKSQSTVPQLQGGRADYTVGVIPQAELHNPLMWSLVGLQATGGIDGDRAMDTLSRRVGPALLFARAEALAASDAEAAETLWRQGQAAVASGEYPEAHSLAKSLADGVLVSAHRRGKSTEADGSRSEADDVSPERKAVYSRLAAAHDEPAGAADILLAGWLHWYGSGLERVLTLANAPEDGWTDMCRFVNGVDDLLCRSLDVAAVHRFYASGGVKV